MQLTKLGIKTFVSKLYIGDYQSLDLPRVVVERKKDLNELCGNVAQDHERFRGELVRALDVGIKIIILVEHGKDIKSLEDVYFWDNPRLAESPKATTGKALYRSLVTIRDKYNVQFEFCTKAETGRRIAELLGWQRKTEDG